MSAESIATAGQRAARAMLEEMVRQEVRRANPSRTIEGMGYLLSARMRSEFYYTPTVSEGRQLVAPEFLSGILTNRIG